MTDAMMNLNVLLEKTSDADMQREMVGPCGRRFAAETHAGGRRRCGWRGARGLLRERYAAGARGRPRGLDRLTMAGHDPVRVG